MDHLAGRHEMVHLLHAAVARVNELADISHAVKRRAGTTIYAAQGCVLRYRSVAAGYFASIAGGRIGRLTKLPWQFGHMPANTVAAQAAQNVHSKVQIRASGLSGGRSRSQHSQFGFSFIMAGLLVAASLQSDDQIQLPLNRGLRRSRNAATPSL
jgi:hypothetical protein